MAKKSTIEKNERRKQMAAKQAPKRKALADTVRSHKASDEEKFSALAFKIHGVQNLVARLSTAHRVGGLQQTIC